MMKIIKPKRKAKVTSMDIRAIQRGEAKEWTFPTPREARNAQALVTYVKTFTPVEGVKGYVTKREGNKLTVQAF